LVTKKNEDICVSIINCGKKGPLRMFYGDVERNSVKKALGETVGEGTKKGKKAISRVSAILS